MLNSANMKSKVYQQCGRTIFKFSLERPWFTFIPCISQSNFFLGRIISLTLILVFNSCSSQRKIEAIENENNDDTRIRVIEEDEDDDEIRIAGR